ncbi:POU domain, class 4, transcription factor 3-like [Parasteatoda tepidariorum]|uniref:POU domain, class 4, transcription factor 3-like n=1 Tax=Parasteatoda tepidariorum TaxID=114398 RepID=UPI00077F9969|nr:POU domain, class 4, transcription factor 3-like [Parasteatoda tepidariorum]
MAHLHDKDLTPTTHCFSDRTPYYRPQQPIKRHIISNHNAMFPPLNENLIHRHMNSMGKHICDSGDHLKHDMIYGVHPNVHHPQASHMDTLEMMEPLCSPSLPPVAHDSQGTFYSSPSSCRPPLIKEDLEAFAERFKQRRIKMGVTQADVGRALVNLKLPGVGTLSQSTICRFESLTLSRNNMVALKPVLQSWLEAAEMHNGKRVLPDKKRKRTSIAAIEKRSLEAYFALQQRPSSDKIASIAQKLDLKKSVVRVWFCNQRQKQKRMKYSTCHNS